MRKILILTVFVLAPALFLLDGCKSKTRPSAKGPGTEIEAKKSDTQQPEADTKGKGPLEARSGIVEYKFTGDKTGKSTQYFDDYGMKSAVYTETTSNGETRESWTLTLGEDQYMWDPSNPGQGMKMKNPMIKMLTESAEKDILSYMTGMYEQMGMTQSGTENFQGKECTVYKGDMGKILIWKGIMMKTEMKVGSIVSGQEVTLIKTNVPVDGKYFRIPENITFNEIPGF